MSNQKTKRKGGRPPKTESERRSPRFSLQLTDDEEAEVRRKAAAAGLRPAVYIRRVVLRQPVEKRAIPKVNMDTHLELGRFAGSLNQLIRAWHRDDRAGAIPREYLEEGINLVRRVRAQLLGQDP